MSVYRRIIAPLGACALSILALPVSAHVSLETREAAVAGSYKAVFRVPHGCKGAATIGLRVKIPEGVIGVKPMPKPGWTLATVKGKYAGSYSYYHRSTVSEGVTEVAWSGGALPDDFYDEFVMQVYLTDSLKPGTMLYFPVVQECAGGAVDRWIEIPAEDRKADDYEAPAPGLKLLPRK
ncbi:YcnI family protein [Vineibacter terrae]|uniref:YcnI family protein n=1 Tax=Vineibacter terrae TaxID=2586908 RepID=A0A5C8PEK6_9HYPH|nr:YcnI family protein [Vineibacter terrae]TXL71925.1 YcnI family protein [Vineibacter terrae]